MIDRSNIRIFDFIVKANYNNESTNVHDLISTYFSNLSDKYINFVLENEELLSKNHPLITQSTSGTGIVVNAFPKLNNNGMARYLEYKKTKFIELIEEEMNYNFKNIEEELNLDGVALTKVIDYLIDSNVIKCNGNYYEENIIGTLDFDFSKLSVVKKINSNYNENVVNENKTIIEHQTNVYVDGNKNKIKNNDFSTKKQELEKESFLSQILNFIKNLFRKK